MCDRVDGRVSVRLAFEIVLCFFVLLTVAYYPHFVLYPPIDEDMPVDPGSYFSGSSAAVKTSHANYSPKPVGLIQPRGSPVTHHG